MCWVEIPKRRCNRRTFAGVEVFRVMWDWVVRHDVELRWDDIGEIMM